MRCFGSSGVGLAVEVISVGKVPGKMALTRIFSLWISRVGTRHYQETMGIWSNVACVVVLLTKDTADSRGQTTREHRAEVKGCVVEFCH